MKRGALLWAVGGLLGLGLLTAAGAFLNVPTAAPPGADAVASADPVDPVDPAPTAGPDICPADSDVCADPDAVACDSADGTCDT